MIIVSGPAWLHLCIEGGAGCVRRHGCESRQYLQWLANGFEAQPIVTFKSWDENQFAVQLQLLQYMHNALQVCTCAVEDSKGGSRSHRCWASCARGGLTAPAAAATHRLRQHYAYHCRLQCPRCMTQSC
jgi:hypothetical protein